MSGRLPISKGAQIQLLRDQRGQDLTAFRVIRYPTRIHTWGGTMADGSKQRASAFVQANVRQAAAQAIRAAAVQQRVDGAPEGVITQVERAADWLEAEAADLRQQSMAELATAIDATTARAKSTVTNDND